MKIIQFLFSSLVRFLYLFVLFLLYSCLRKLYFLQTFSGKWIHLNHILFVLSLICQILHRFKYNQAQHNVESGTLTALFSGHHLVYLTIGASLQVIEDYLYLGRWWWGWRWWWWWLLLLWQRQLWSRFVHKPAEWSLLSQ